MSMISSLIDKLRQMADGQATYRDAREMMLQAADTIWELRDDLQRANAAVQDAEHDESMAWDRVRKTEAENAKLRELLSESLMDYKLYAKKYGLPPYLSDVNEHLDARMRELGIEVDG